MKQEKTSITPKVPHVQVPDPDGIKLLKPTDKLVYANIRRYMNKDTMTCYPSIQTLAKVCDITPQTVQNSIKRLVKYNFIKILKEKHNGKNNIYKLEKLTDNFERFTPEFLDSPNLSAGEKAFLIGMQSQCYKNGTFAITSYSNKELGKTLNMTPRTIAKYTHDLSEESRGIMQELQLASCDSDGFRKAVKAINLAKIGQQVLFEVAVNHEDRIQQLETFVATLIKQNKLLEKENKKLLNIPTTESFGF